MYRRSSPLFLVCETPTHVGSGAELGIVDLPIQREKHTSFPKFEASSIKGAIRDRFERQFPYEAGAGFGSDALKVQRFFGLDEHAVRPEEKNALKNLFKPTKAADKEDDTTRVEYAAALGFSDARLLLFPVKSMRGVFAWIICPSVWAQLLRDMSHAKIAQQPPALSSEVLAGLATGHALVCPNSSLLIAGKNKNPNIVLEEYVFQAQPNETLNELAQWLIVHALHSNEDYRAQKLQTNLVLVSDNDFTDFVNLSTEVITRTRIDNATGTVASGALFTEEYLPAESILYSLMLTTGEHRKDAPQTEAEVYEFLKNVLAQGSFQIGGNATLGKGIISCKLTKGGDNQ